MENRIFWTMKKVLLPIPVAMLLAGCSSGNWGSGGTYGTTYRSPEQAMMALARKGDIMSMYNAGVAFARMGDTKNLGRAIYWYKKAADAGYSAAQYNLGQLYEQGAGGLPRDMGKAFYWYSKAAKQGLSSSQNNLGLLYAQGVNGVVAQDYAKAAEWYGLAAAQGDPHAENNMGSLFHQGLGVPQSYENAAQFYAKAAKKGLTEAQLNLGMLYATGHGVVKNSYQAYKWCRLGAASVTASVRNKALTCAGKASSLLSSAQIRQANSEVSAFRVPKAYQALPNPFQGQSQSRYQTSGQIQYPNSNITQTKPTPNYQTPNQYPNR